MHISSLLLQLIGSYGKSDSPVFTNTVLQETQLGIPLSSSQAHRIYGCLGSVQVFLLVSLAFCMGDS